jgi:uncharacterized cupin superfamily protein
VPSPNVFEPEFDEPRDRRGFACRRARVGRQAGAQRLGASVWEIPPGQAAYPYHYHLTEEEMLIVLSGEPELRTADGTRALRAGDVVSFARGPGGGHQLVNRGSTPARVLAVSTSGEPDLVMYPDSAKLGAFERRPGPDQGLYQLFRLDDAVDYWEGEEPPR